MSPTASRRVKIVSNEIAIVNPFLRPTPCSNSVLVDRWLPNIFSCVRSHPRTERCNYILDIVAFLWFTRAVTFTHSRRFFCNLFSIPRKGGDRMCMGLSTGSLLCCRALWRRHTCHTKYMLRTDTAGRGLSGDALPYHVTIYYNWCLRR